MRSAALACLVLAVSATTAFAQTRVTLPAGSVFLVRTDQQLHSGTMKAGDPFTTTVTEAVSVDGYLLIPENTKIHGVVSFVQPATSSRSGVMQVDFERLTLPNNVGYGMIGRLTSTDSAERRQIESRSDPRVVLYGGRSGPGATIAGASSSSSPAAGILAALGNMLSGGRNVDVPAGTPLAVQLVQSLSMTSIGSAYVNDASTIFTSTDHIRAAQQELARLGYYRGAIDGQLDIGTRRALFDFQARNNITPTGDLTGRTARALGILTDVNVRGDSILSVREATVLRDAAQALVARQRADLGITTAGRMTRSRTVAQADLELLFAFSAFQANAQLYDELVRASGSAAAVVLAGRALVNGALRVDAAMQQARPSRSIQNVWLEIRRQLAAIDQSYR